jgi:hypothetical protein
VNVVLNELSGAGFYGSLAALDHTRPLAEALEDVFLAGRPNGAPGTTWWVSPQYRSTKFDGSDARGVNDLQSDELSITAGGNTRFNQNWGAAVGVGYGHDRASTDLARGDINSYMAGAGLYYVGDMVNVSAQFDYAWNTYSMDRAIPSLARETNADFNGHELRGRIEAAYRFGELMNGNILPYIALDFHDISMHAFSENNRPGAGGVALNVAENSNTRFDPKIGVRWMGNTWNTGPVGLFPELEASYTFNDPDTGSDLAFAGGGSTFHTQGVDPKGYFTLMGGLFGGIGSAGSFGLQVGGDFAGKQTGVMVGATLRVQLY